MIIVTGSGKRASSNDSPVMLRLTKKEKEHIAQMPDDEDLFVAHPQHWPEYLSRRWVEANKSLVADESTHKANQPVVIEDNNVQEDNPSSVIEKDVHGNGSVKMSDSDIVSLLSDGVVDNESQDVDTAGSTLKDEELLSLLDSPSLKDGKGEAIVDANFSE